MSNVTPMSREEVAKLARYVDGTPHLTSTDLARLLARVGVLENEIRARRAYMQFTADVRANKRSPFGGDADEVVKDVERTIEATDAAGGVG